MEQSGAGAGSALGSSAQALRSVFWAGVRRAGRLLSLVRGQTGNDALNGTGAVGVFEQSKALSLFTLKGLWLLGLGRWRGAGAHPHSPGGVGAAEVGRGVRASGHQAIWTCWWGVAEVGCSVREGGRQPRGVGTGGVRRTLCSVEVGRCWEGQVS